MPTLDALRLDHQRLTGWFRRMHRRVSDLEDGRVVKVVESLPTNAPATMLLRDKTTGNLYMGNGPNQPLSRFTPEP